MAAMAAIMWGEVREEEGGEGQRRERKGQGVGERRENEEAMVRGSF